MPTQQPEIIEPKDASVGDMVVVLRGNTPLGHGPVTFDEKRRPYIETTGAYLGSPDADPVPRVVIRLSKAGAAKAHPKGDTIASMVPAEMDPRCWYSPTKGYYISVWPGGDALTLAMHVDTRETSFELPEDARELGAAPTQWAYDKACEALKKHRERADNAVGQMRQLSAKIRKVVGGDFVGGYMPAEIGVDALIHKLRMTERPEVRDTPEMIDALHLIDRLLIGDSGAPEDAAAFQHQMELDPTYGACVERVQATAARARRSPGAKES